MTPKPSGSISHLTLTVRGMTMQTARVKRSLVHTMLCIMIPDRFHSIHTYVLSNIHVKITRLTNTIRVFVSVRYEHTSPEKVDCLLRCVLYEKFTI